MDSVHANLKTKTRPMTHTLKPDASYNLDLEPLGPCNSEPLKKSKSSRAQLLFEKSRTKNFAIFTWKHLCWRLFSIKLQAFRPATFLKRGSKTVISCGYPELF